MPLVTSKDFLKKTIEGRSWRNLMDALPAESAAMAMSTDDGNAAHLARSWMASVEAFVAE